MRRWPVAALALGTLVSCRSAPASRELPAASGVAREVRSNVLREDYAGSESCAGCHAALHAEWKRSPMHRMTRDVATAEVHAPFDGVEFPFMSQVARMTTKDGQRLMGFGSPDQTLRWFRVTKVIGGRYREDFAGVELVGLGKNAATVGEERVLPVSYLMFNQSWRYKGYSVMVPERPELRSGVVWRKSCIFCHNTPPHLTTIYDDLFGEGAPKYQGSTSVELPPERRFQYEVTDADALLRALADERALLGDVRESDPDAVSDQLAAAIGATRRGFGETHLVEVGVGCEACHGGAKEHVLNPAVRTSFGLRSDFVRVLTGDGQVPNRAQDINRSCAQCHTVLFSRYPHTWEGGRRDENPGGSNINSGEARDFMLGACGSQLHCATCHDPHKEDSKSLLQALETPGRGVCLDCHAEYRDPLRLQAHTHHAPNGAGSVCVNCHMPKKNMALDYRLSRYHRIGSPTDHQRVEGDRPMECALCHADKSVDQLVGSMERMWNKSYDRAALRRLYGRDLDVDVLSATLSKGKPHEQAVAVHLAAQAARRDLMPLLVEQLANPYPLVRFHAHDAIQMLSGGAGGAQRSGLSLDLHRPGDELVRDARRWLVEQGSDQLLP